MITPAVKLRAEFKPLLSLLSLSLDFSKEILKKTFRVNIEKHQIIVENDGCSKFVFELEGLILLPASCRSLRWASSSELQFSLQANQENDSKDSNGISSHKTSPTNQDFLVSRIQSSQNLCHCVGCGMRIFKSHSCFKRVLPLPSENWSDFADIWFCHNHSHSASDSQTSVSCSGDGSVPDDVKELKKIPMLPRVDDCLVSNLYMLVDSSHVKSGSLSHTSGRLICKRCGNFLGFIKDEKSGVNQVSGVIYKIYHHAVSFRNEKSYDSLVLNNNQATPLFKCEKQQHVEDFMSCLLRDQSHIFTSFRFILTSSLQAKEQSSISILLWLLDQDLDVFSSCLPPTHNSANSSVKASSKRYIKLLYKAQFSNLGECNQSATTFTKASGIFDAWRLDNTVHGISLPYPLCKQLVHMLVSSTKTLTKSQRSLNGFHVGFLKVN